MDKPIARRFQFSLRTILGFLATRKAYGLDLAVSDDDKSDSDVVVQIHPHPAADKR